MNEKSYILHGIGASPGIAIGFAFVLEDEEIIVNRLKISKDEVKNELNRLKVALSKTREEMTSLRDKAIKALGKSHARLFEAYLLILQDPLITKDAVKIIESEHLNAESAVKTVIDRTARALEQIDDEYFRDRRYDLLDVGNKILRHLLGKERKTLSSITEPCIIIAHNLTPSDSMGLKDRVALGFVTDIGGKTSHTALLAQSLEIPAVVGLRDVTSHIRAGDLLVVDGNEGTLVVNPGQNVLENYRREQAIYLAEDKALEKLKDLPAQTLDDYRIQLAANIDAAEEVRSALSHGAEGIGLYRTEYLYLNRTSPPTEEEHFNNYKQAAVTAQPYSVIIRTVDLGGDKISLLGLKDLPHETNPFLGLRGIRLCLKFPELFQTQLRAILRASSHGKIKIMYPMVSGLQELLEANKILSSVKEQLRSSRIPFDQKIEVGIMIEVPSAALLVDLLAPHVDFFSIGTNDLIQYTLAVDRINENVAHLYDPQNPAVLRLIQRVAEAGHAAGKWVGLCGEMAADAQLTPLLIGLGIDELSTAPAAVPKIKRAIRSLNKSTIEKLVKEAMSSNNLDAIAHVVSRKNPHIQ